MTMETFENLCASLLDMASVMFAYSLGVSQLGILAGVGYAVFDAWLVVWQRKRVARFIHALALALQKHQRTSKEGLYPFRA